MIKYESYNPENATNCILRSFSKITGKNPRVIEKELIELSNKLNHSNYSDIEVFEKYLELMNFEKEPLKNSDIQIKDLELDSKTYSIFCWNKKDFYHLVTIQNGILYDKKISTLELYPISIYKSKIIDMVKNIIIERSNKFEKETKGTKDEYNLWLEHVQYVYKYAVMIAENKKVDKEVVEISALLHDIAMTDRTLDRSRHNEYGSEIAGKILLEIGYNPEKIELVKKCILNHSSKRKDFRTTEEEKVLVNADAMAHFDCIDSLYSLATKVMGLNEEDSVQFIKDKLTKDYLEIDEDVREIVKNKYEEVMNFSTKLIK